MAVRCAFRRIRTGAASIPTTILKRFVLDRAQPVHHGIPNRSDFTQQDNEWRSAGKLYLQMIGEDLHPFDEFLNENPGSPLVT